MPTDSKQFSSKPTVTTNNKKQATRNNNTTKQFSSSKQFTHYQQQQQRKPQQVQSIASNKRLNANTRPNTRIIGKFIRDRTLIQFPKKL